MKAEAPVELEPFLHVAHHMADVMQVIDITNHSRSPPPPGGSES
jgi:hypothetical protein